MRIIIIEAARAGAPARPIWPALSVPERIARDVIAALVGLLRPRWKRGRQVSAAGRAFYCPPP